jgi:hypothetical protein
MGSIAINDGTNFTALIAKLVTLSFLGKDQPRANVGP